MWSDNAAEVDLLGYDDLIDDIATLALDRNLQPLTIGAFADWGAGKSTLLRLAANTLRESDALVIEFNPWLVEGYDDVKSCLLGAVIDAIEASKSFTERQRGRAAALLESLRNRIDWLRLARLGATAVVPLVGVPLQHLEQILKAEDGQSSHPRLASSAAVSQGFHREFEELIEGLDSVSSVVVLIDDLDRCLPDQVIDTLEAIRLFLAAPGTAFVIAADERLVRDAVRHRYPTSTAAETNIANDYLEKLVHIPLRIPPLDQSAAETYCNLLVSQRALGAGEFTKVLQASQTLRRQGILSVSCNLGIVREAIDQQLLPKEVEADLGLIAQIIGPLTVGLKGNPRQIKRFLNSFQLRRRTARRRELDIDDAVLAKLTVLEYARDTFFRELYTWQLRGAGIPSEIGDLEESVNRDETAVEMSAAAQAWLADSWMRAWLETEPQVRGLDLSPYFFLARERLGSTEGTSERLPPSLQVLTAQLAQESTVVREQAVDRVIELDIQDISSVVQAGCARLNGLQDKQPMMRSLVEIGEKHPAMIPTLIAAFMQIAYPSVPMDMPLIIASRLKSPDFRQLVVELLTVWEKQDASGHLSRTAMRARTTLSKGNGNI